MNRNLKLRLTRSSLKPPKRKKAKKVRRRRKRLSLKDHPSHKKNSTSNLKPTTHRSRFQRKCRTISTTITTCHTLLLKWVSEFKYEQLQSTNFMRKQADGFNFVKSTIKD